jgi:segregation and condensation protein B
VDISEGEGQYPEEGAEISELTDLERILEAILFSLSRPITLKKLEKGLEEFTQLEIHSALSRLERYYAFSRGSVEIVEVAGGYQMRTRAEYKDWVKRFIKEKDVGLTRAMLETLAIIAYRQPIAKRDIDNLRGVDSIRSIKQLLDRKLVEMAGRNQEPGKPIVFRTTAKFLEHFGLKDMGDLPTIKELEALDK